MILIKVVKAIVVRLSLILHVLVTVWRVTVDLDDDIYWLLAVIMVPFLIESAYTIIKRRGEDFRLFTPCFFFYLMMEIPCIWLLEIKKSDTFLDEEAEKVPNNETNVVVNTLGIGEDISPGTWTVLIEELLLYLLIVGRWVLPRGKVSREQLSELLFAFIGIASDIMEMFSLFGLEDVRKNRTLSYFVLGCWSLSVLQFSMTVTVIHEPRRAKNIKTIDDNDYEKKKPKIYREILAIICSMMMQDIPFLTLRLYTIIRYDIINYSLIFFTAKNILVILLLLYKIAVLLQKRYCPEFLDKDEDIEIHGEDTDGKKDGRFHHINEDLSDDPADPKEKRRNGDVYDLEKGEANKAFESDNSKQSSSNGPESGISASPSVSRTSNQPDETTPLRQRKGENPQQTTPRPSSAADSKDKPSTPGVQQDGPATPSTGRPPQSTQKGQPNDQKVASGYGWVSSKPAANAK